MHNTFERATQAFRNTARSLHLLITAALLLVATSIHAQISLSGSGGEPDRDFGTLAANGQSGVYLFTSAVMSSVLAAGIQSSARPILVGTCGVNPNEDICVARLTRDGTQIDSSFAVGGVARFNSGGQDYGYAISVDSNDRIVVAGVCGGVACVLRYAGNGSVDTSYGVAGRSGVQGMIRANSMLIDASDNTIVGGECYQAGLPYLCVARLTSSGAFDATFNGGNVRMIGLGSASGESVSGLTLDASGNLLVTGYCRETLAAQTYSRFCVMRLLPSGAFDTAFNTTGYRVFALGNTTQNYSSGGVSITPDGRVVVSGACLNASFISLFCAARLTASGQLDTTFGVDSFAGLGYQIINDVPTPNSVKVRIDEASRLLLIGSCPNGFCMARMLASGRPDSLFGNNGMRLYRPDPANPTAEQRGGVFVALDGNRILQAGYCGTATPGQFRGCVARYYIDTPPGERCSLDIDGDGAINAATDGVIWARALLGIRGAALTQGAIGARAQRTSADAVATHLATHCGIR